MLYFCQVSVARVRERFVTGCSVWPAQLFAGFLMWPYGPGAEWWCQAQAVLMTYLPLAIFSLVLCVNISMYRLFVKVRGPRPALCGHGIAGSVSSAKVWKS